MNFQHFSDIVSTMQILKLHRERKTTSGLHLLPSLDTDFTWIVGSADALTTMDRCMFKVCIFLNFAAMSFTVAI